MDRRIYMCARFEAKSEHREELRTRLLEMVKLTNEEAGCLFYNLHLDAKNDCVFYFLEGWENKEAHALHEQTPYIQAIIKDAPVLTQGGIRLEVMSLISPKNKY
jgi:quinol monooxygenase YgiN